MIAQYRPDIARAAEETVLNLKELENRLDVLRQDLAWLCNNLGHTEAARVAATPSRLVGATGAFGAVGMPYGQVNPWQTVPQAGFVPSFPYGAIGTPNLGGVHPAFGLFGLGPQGIVPPWQTAPFGQIGAVPFGVNPQVGAFAAYPSSFAAFSPFR